MASVLDLGLLKEFSVIFSALFIIAVVYGILQYTKILGDRKGLHMFIAFFIGMMILLFPGMGDVITTIVPWFVLMFILILMILITQKMFGATDSDLLTALKKNPQITSWVIFFSMIILLSAFGKIFFSPASTDETTPEVTLKNGTIVRGEIGETGPGAFWATIVHPKVLGLIMLLAVGIFTILMLGGSPPQKK